MAFTGRAAGPFPHRPTGGVHGSPNPVVVSCEPFDARNAFTTDLPRRFFLCVV